MGTILPMPGPHPSPTTSFGIPRSLLTTDSSDQSRSQVQLYETTPLPGLVTFQTCVSPIPAMPTSKLLTVIVTSSVRPVVSQKEIHKPLVIAERNRPGGQELVKVKEKLIKSRSEPGREPGAPQMGRVGC